MRLGRGLVWMGIFFLEVEGGGHTWTPATNRGKQLSMKAAPTRVLMAVTWAVSSCRPAAMRATSWAQRPVCWAAMPAASTATGGMEGCERCSMTRPM